MPFDAGMRVGPYEILSVLGAGGMGVVYRAQDTHLGRQVALKIVADAVATDPDRVMRFEREARTLAALNDPNIAALHGIEGSRALLLNVPDRPEPLFFLQGLGALARQRD